MFRSTCDAPGQVVGGFAQAMSGASLKAIGQIQTTSGSITVTSASGAVVPANCGDFVRQRDTIETGADGYVGLIFNDGTAFNLSSDSRMVLSEFVYDPNGKSSSTLFSLSKGTFAFIPGKAAAPTGLRIDTPVGRIRGTAGEGGIGILTLAGLTFSVLDQIQAASQSPHGFLDDGAVTVGNQASSRSHAFLDDDRLTYKHLPHGGYEITMRDGRVIMHDDPGETIQIDPSGTVTHIPNSSSRMADLQNFQQTALSTLSQGPQGAAPGGSSTETFNSPLQLQPINFTRPENGAVQNQVTVNIAPATSGFIEVPQLEVKLPSPTPPPPTIAISTIAGQISVATDSIINASRANAGVNITGTTSGIEDGQIVAITVVDGSNHVVYSTTATVTNGTWLITVTSTDAKLLADGSYLLTADVSNVAGNPAQTSQAITVDQDLNEHPSVLLNGGATTPIGAADAGQVAFTISGLEADDSGTLIFSDQAGHTVVVTIVNGQAVDSQGHPISTINLSSLSDGTITSSLAISDMAGNQFSAIANAVPLEQKPGEHPSILVNGGSATPIGLAGAGHVAFTISGLASDDSGTLIFSDQAGHTVVVTIANGQAVDSQGHPISTVNLSSLSDGTITSSLAVSDTGGNHFSASGNTVPLDQDLDEHPSLLVNGGATTPIGAAGAGQVTFTIAGFDPEDTGTVTFTDANGKTIQVHVTGGQTSYAASLSSLADGSISSSLAVNTDTAGNNFQPVAGNAVTLDKDIGEQLAVNFSGLTAGHAVEDNTITAIVTDTDNDVPTSGITYSWQISRDGGNTWSAVGANTPTYTPGEDDEGGLLKVLVSFTDAAGNTESGSSTVGVLPLLTIANTSLSVSPNGSVSLGISLTQEPTPDDTISVTISFPSSGAHTPTIAAGDHATGNPHTSGGITTYTFSAADINSGLTFTNHGDLVDTLTVNETVNGNTVATSQTITVTDPPASTTTSDATMVPVVETTTLTATETAGSQTGVFKIDAGVTLQLESPDAVNVKFAASSGPLILDHSLTQPFSAVMSGLGAGDTIDLKDLVFTSGHITATASFVNGNTTLEVTNTSTEQSVTLTLAGDYTHSTWDFAQDSGTGTILHNLPATNADGFPLDVPGSASAHLAMTVTAALTIPDQFAFQDGSQSGTFAIGSASIASGKDASATHAVTLDTTDNQPTGTATPSGPADSSLMNNVAMNAHPATGDTSNGTQAGMMSQTASASPTATGPNGSDTFVFSTANLGHETVTNFHPDTDVIEVDHTVFAGVQALLAAAHDDGHGNAVITADPHDSITVKNVTVAQLVQHQGDFHFT